MNIIAGLTAFFLGALHALEPGHGKSAIAAYAVGYRSSLPQILVLGLTTALAHTATILVLAAIIGITVSTVAGETMQVYVEIGSAVLLLAIGIGLWRRSARNSTQPEHDNRHCSCGSEEVRKETAVSYRVVGLLGVSTGLLPCPTALAVLLSSMTAGHFVTGIWTVCLFSIGIAITMCAVACAAMFFARSSMAAKIGDLLQRSRLSTYLPIVSSWVIILSGVFTLVRVFIHSE